MKRLIYSLYINIPEEDIERDHQDDDWISYKTKETTDGMLEYKDWLIHSQEKYARSINADYKFVGYSSHFEQFKNEYFKDRPWISTYDIINFYKLRLMYDAVESENYDEVLYLDFDVVPLTDVNVFEELDFQSGMLCRVNHERNPNGYLENLEPGFFIEMRKKYERNGRTNSIRSPRAKWWNARALLIDEGFSGDNDVYNTGIVGGSKEQINKLSYFENFEQNLDYMKGLATEVNGGWPPYIQTLFGYDNETLFSYQMQMNEVKLNPMTREWHFILNERFPYIAKGSKFVHIVNKRFDYVKEWYEKNNI